MEERKESFKTSNQGGLLQGIQTNFYSTFSIYGKDIKAQYKQYQLSTNFHARLLNSLDERLIYHETLDNLYQPIIKQQTQLIKHGKIADEQYYQQMREEQLKAQADRPPSDSIVKVDFDFKNCKYKIRTDSQQRQSFHIVMSPLHISNLENTQQVVLILHIVPPQYGGVDYKEQYELL